MNGDKDNLIRSLKAAVKGREDFICNLLCDRIAKNKEINKLKERIEFLEKWARWNKIMQDTVKRNLL